MLVMPEVGTTFEPQELRWRSRDSILYALGIGAGQDDALQDLQFTTDTTRAHPQAVFPTFAVVAGCPAGIVPLIEAMKGSADLRLMLHGEQSVEQWRPLPPTATVHSTARVTAAWDKGTSTVLQTTTDVRDAASGELYASTTQSMFFRGVGGWGGARGPATPAREHPTRAPDAVLAATTRHDQALLYRLSGDPNPLHTDPAVAAHAGFGRPILHGLCTYGVAGRVLLRRYADNDPARFRSLEARMSKPIVPGQSLRVLTWVSPDGIDFVVVDDVDEVVLDKGLLRVAT